MFEPIKEAPLPCRDCEAGKYGKYESCAIWVETQGDPAVCKAKYAKLQKELEQQQVRKSLENYERIRELRARAVTRSTPGIDDILRHIVFGSADLILRLVKKIRG